MCRNRNGGDQERDCLGKRIQRSYDGFFEGMREFVDSGISDLTTGWRAVQDRATEHSRAMRHQWTGNDDKDADWDEISTAQRERGVSLALALLRENRVRSRDVARSKIQALYDDGLPLPQFGRHGGDGFGSVLHLFGWQPQWLSLNWFKYSAYSPVALETTVQRDWRGAFEDLISASLGRQMGVRGRGDLTEPGLSWMVGLMRRGVLPIASPPSVVMRRVRRDVGTESVKRIREACDEGLLDDDEGSGDGPLELSELVEELVRPTRPLTPLLKAQERKVVEMPAERQVPWYESEPEDEEAEALGLVDQKPRHVKGPERVDVLSSLTTSYTTRSADGTVTTKTILKQRFADGREETKEENHTYKEQPSFGEDDVQEPKQISDVSKMKKKKGWFWS
ncbi:hypothetical protein K470DRAFT_271140 [Piedraia hortae CBS 480.64]|uniref:Uncharacterized protein n=1 Tax=Piedraia hortae CBS 480.64 TaxID=1314780 RepID=A0A6A7BZB8_9PEZI|nr:hypothetical protein K470DRAFT_271140 [Piedraia hortae CBS 480.64]